MSKYTKEKMKEHLELVKRHMIKQPNATVFQIQKNIYQEIRIKLDKDYIYKLQGKIIGNRVTRYNRGTKNIFIAEFEDFIWNLAPKLYKIIDDEKGKPNYKISAMRTLVDNYQKLLNMQLDLGIWDTKSDEAMFPIVMNNMAEFVKFLNTTDKNKV